MKINTSIIKKLRQDFGDAFYLLDSQQFRKNFTELKAAFAIIYPNFNIAYSYKTNYTPKLCGIINQMNGYAEVVSKMELEIALRVGVPYNRIIWNGPIKDPSVAENYLLAGGTINIDSIEETEYIRDIAQKHPNCVLNVGIRCNFDVGDGMVSRFGLDTEGEDFMNTVEFVCDTENIKFRSLQCHFAKRQIEYWPARAKGMVSLIDRLGIIPETIDIGGGMYGKMDESLKVQFSSAIPDYKDYAQAAATVFVEFFKDKEQKPELLIEPGSALVGDCMTFVGTVKTIKNIRGKYFASVLGSQKNISMGGVNPPMTVISMGKRQIEYTDVDFVGFTCIEGDVLYHGYNGKLAHGDAVVISNCGSYSIVMKPPFILPNFPVIDISEGGTEIIKREETFEDLFHTFKI